MTDRRRFLSLAGGGLLWLSSFPFCGRRRRPNVLLILADDLRAELGCYGASHVRSPNIDALAADAMVFERAYCQQAVCAPARACLLTGCRPDTTGVDFPYTKWFTDVFLRDHPDLMARFFHNRYWVSTLGKVHHGQVPKLELSEPRFRFSAAMKNAARAAGNAVIQFRSGGDQDHHDGAITTEAIARLRRAAGSGKPFLLVVGYTSPHLPYSCPESYSIPYRLDEIPLPLAPAPPENAPAFAHIEKKRPSVLLPESESLDWHLLQDRGGHFSPRFTRTLRRGYYSCVSFLDAQVGRLLDELRALRLWDDTIVAFISDQGIHLGEHASWTKQSLCEVVTHVPLIIRVPGAAKGRSPGLIEQVDLYPTLLELCGIPVPEYVEGTSFVPLLSRPRQEWKSAVFSQYPRGYPGAPGFLEGYAIRTRTDRYSEWRREDGETAAIEFYDLVRDPDESRNAVAAPAYAATVARRRDLLGDGWKAALPAGVINRSHNPRGEDSEYLESWKAAQKKEEG